MFDFGANLKRTGTPHRPDDSTAAIPAHQNAAYRVALLLAIGIGVIHDGTSRDETVTIAIGRC
jgi:hypothetical protein